MPATRVRVGNPLTVSTTRAHARARRMPQSGLGLQLGGIMPPACLGDSLGRRRAPRDASDTPACLGDSLGRRRAPRDASDAPRARGDALFFVAVGGTKRKMPTRVWGLPVPVPASGERPHAPGLAPEPGEGQWVQDGTPARARAGRASALSRPDARGNARTRQGWPVLAGDEDAPRQGNARTRQGWSPVRLPPGCPPPLGVRAQEP